MRQDRESPASGVKATQVKATLPNVVRALALFGAVCIAIASVAGLVGRWWWILDLCSHFRLQLAAGALATMVVLGALRAWKWLALAAAAFTLNLALIAPLYWGGETAFSDTEPTLEILVFNAYYANTNSIEVANYAANADADLIIIIEASDAMREPLVHALPNYEVFGHTRIDAFGMLAFSRLPVASHKTVYFADSELPALALEVTKGGKPFSVLGLHTMPPAGSAGSDLRDTMMHEAAIWAREHDNAIIAGDLNATPWSFAFADMLETGDLHNSQRGFGLQTSWPAQLWPLSIAIDHCLHSKTLRTISRSVGPFMGSDHRPLRLKIGFAARKH